MTSFLLLGVVVCVGAYEDKSPISFNPAMTEEGERLWEGDMILSSEQVDLLFGPIDTRKAIPDERVRWTNGVVPFTIDKTSVPHREIILESIQHWMNHTCLKFNEVSAGAQQPHLIFNKLNGCFSHVGMQWWKNGQIISIGYGCLSMGTVAHEIGHAIGFYHEHARSDRDQYVQILKENIIKDNLDNFDKHKESNNYGVPYDFGSVMHYKLNEFSRNGKPTLVPKDVTQTFKIQRNGLSFYDVKMANLMYKCDATCKSKPACQNQGFVSEDCTCRCPDGFTGSNCENYVGIPDSCGGRFSTPTTITTPNHPNNYPPESGCVWAFEAPSGKRVKAYFPEFDLLERAQGNVGCRTDYLEVRNESYDGKKYCEKDLKDKEIISDGNQMAFLFKTYFGVNTGFKAEITFV